MFNTFLSATLRKYLRKSVYKEGKQFFSLGGFGALSVDPGPFGAAMRQQGNSGRAIATHAALQEGMQAAHLTQEVSREGTRR